MIKADEGMVDLHRGNDLHREDRGGEVPDLHREPRVTAWAGGMIGGEVITVKGGPWTTTNKDILEAMRSDEQRQRKMIEEIKAERESARQAEQDAKARQQYDWLVDRVEMWARVLGVSHWRLVVAIGAGDEVLGKTSIARLHRTDFYREAAIMFRDGAPPDGLYSIPEAMPDLDKSIVHELLHLVTDEIDREMTDALLFIEDKDVRSRLADRMIMRLEQVIEDLAESIVELGQNRPDQIHLGRVTAAPGLLTAATFTKEREPDGADDLEDRIPTALPDDEKVKAGMMRDDV